MSWVSTLLSLIGLGAEKSAPTTINTVATDVTTQAKQVTGALDLYLSIITGAQAAWNAPSLQAEIIGGLGVADAIIKVAAQVDPQLILATIPVEILERLVPLVVPLAGFKKVGPGTWVSDAWALNPREALNSDGTFKDKNLIPPVTLPKI